MKLFSSLITLLPIIVFGFLRIKEYDETSSKKHLHGKLLLRIVNFKSLF